MVCGASVVCGKKTNICIDDPLNVGLPRNQHSLRLLFLSLRARNANKMRSEKEKKLAEIAKNEEESREMRSQDLCLANIHSVVFFFFGSRIYTAPGRELSMRGRGGNIWWQDSRNWEGTSERCLGWNIVISFKIYHISVAG